MKRFLRDYSVLTILAGAIIFFDQISKNWIRANLEMGGVWMPWEWLMPYARIVHWHNTGVAFGMFQGGNQIFAILSIVVSMVIIFYFPRVAAEDWSLRLAMGMQLGGAVGNLVDRITIGHVTDFISIGNFPVFNVADSSISVGVGILLLGVWLQERKMKLEQKRGSPSPTEPVSESEVNP